ncbi:MAG: TonB-dependent receptor [Dysgonamonadaceae bacterium]|jgi:TonB-linked SusC/RagA family outer membrane protein|nr:TonB-dependent receptor [Dysgonamonadaceae bacterium]
MKKILYQKRLSINNLCYILKIMKITVLLLFLGIGNVFSKSYSQSALLSLKMDKQPIEEVFDAIENMSEYVFFFSDEIKSDIKKKVSVSAKSTTLDKILDDLFEETELSYIIKDRQVMIARKEGSAGFAALQQQPEKPHSLSGKVMDENGEPLIGVSISVKGTDTRTITDSRGNYYIETPSDGMIDFSYIGFQNLSVSVNKRTTIDIVLKEDAQSIDEVVVVGYGTLKKETLSGAISTISNKDILTTKSPSLAVALAGKVSGLQIRQNNGLPGSFNTNINVRGLGTPLFVIDGVVRNEPTEFQKLNPEDIESITVLKDASAAIYGINSSNGAILVKTKSGSKGPLRASYNMLFGITSPTHHTEMMNVKQYWEIRNEDGVNSGGAPYFSSREELEKAQALPYTNWYDEVFKQSAFQQQHNLILQGGNETVSTYFSVGYNTDNGLFRSGDIGYNKYSLRNATKFNVNKDLIVELNLYGYTDYRKQPGTWDDAFFYLNKAVHGLIPSETVYANNNPLYYNRPRPLNDNPIQFSERDNFGYGEWRDRFIQVSLGITYNIPSVEGFKIKLQGAYDAKTYIRTRVQKRIVNYIYSPATETYSSYNNYDPSIQEENTNLSRVNFQGHLLYEKQIAGDHNVAAVLVGEARENNDRYLSGKRFYEGDFFTIDVIDRAPSTNQQTSGNTSRSTYMSLIGRLNYDFRNKYLFEFAFREDGSYRYAPEKRWGFFPVVSIGWRIAEENFFKDNLPVISNLKLRASHGITGQDAGSPFQHIVGYSSYNGYVLDASGKYVNGYTSGSLSNQNLTWTTSETSDIGIDSEFWNGKLTFSMDVYRRNRSGLLTTRLQALPNTFGASLPQENLNKDRTDGFELLLGHKNRINAFQYGVSANMNVGRTKTIFTESAPFRSSMDRWKNGSVDRWHDIGWGYQVVGQYQNYEEIRNGVIETGSYGNSRTLPGDYIHLDVNGDGIISGADMAPIFWNGQPKLNFGITFFAAWKGLDFNMLWQGAGMYSLKYNEILGQVLALDSSNSPAIYYDRWHLADIYDPNSDWIPGKFPATRRLDSDNGANYLESDIKRVDASYARLKNIELGYTIPAQYLKLLGISNLRCYFNGFNLLVICNSYLKSFDPEITDGNGFQYPLSRSYNFGVNLTF